jgi:hypothetical protein
MTRAQMVDLVTAVNSLTYLVLGSGVGFAILIAVLQVASYKVDWCRRRVNFQVRRRFGLALRICVEVFTRAPFTLSPFPLKNLTKIFRYISRKKI